MNYLVIVISVFVIAASHLEGPFSLEKQRILISPPSNLEFFSFGYQMTVADTLWLRAIQDFDYCENLLQKNLCVGNGWLSKMLDSLTNLAPDYLAAYYRGGLALTILVSDYPGASKIFDKGVRVFPKDKKLLYVAAYHAMIEEKNNMKAADLFIKAAKNGAPEWLYALATGLYSRSGQKELAEELYKKLNEEGVDGNLLQRMRKKIDSAE